MAEWKKYKWGDLISLEYGKPVGDKECTTGKYPVYGTNGKIGTTNLPPLCNYASIIVGRKGAYRGIHYSSTPFSVIDTAFYVKPLTNKLNLKWAYYKLLTLDINRMDSGSAIPSTDRYEIYSLPLELPPLEEQKQIADILSSLDDKIEVNRKINENLEQQAEALFKSWFVDFEPFKDGKFIDSELGKIPEGWRVCELGKILQINKQSVNPLKYPNEEFYHYSLPLFDEGKSPEKQLGKDILSNKFVITDKTTLFSKLNPRIKRVWFVNKAENNSICSTEFVPYKAINENLNHFVFSLINSTLFYDQAMSLVNGATSSHQRFHAQDTLTFKIAFNEEVACKFDTLVASMLQFQNLLIEEIKTLAAMRKSLLPKLMSGEIKL